MPLVTFDFHDTIAHCDDWFQLEIRTLPANVAATLAPKLDPDALQRAYRTLRQRVMESGVEVDACEGVIETFAAFGFHPARSDVEYLVDEAMRAALATATPVPGIVDTVADLHASGHTLGIVSSAVHHDFLEWTLAAFGISEAFTFVLSSARAGMYKSDAGIYCLALQLGAAEASKSIHVGDNPRWDVAQAASVGMRTVWIDHGRGGIEGPVAADCTIRNFEDDRAMLMDFIASVRCA